MSRVLLEFQIRQEMLEADARPSRGADQVSGDRVRDARQRDELLHWLIPTDFFQRQLQRAVHQAADLQSPLVFVDRPRKRVDVDTVVTFEWCEFWARARGRLDQRVGVGQRNAHLLEFPLGRSAAPSTPDNRSHLCSDGRDDGRRTAESDDEPAAIEALDLGPIDTLYRGRRGNRVQTRVRPAKRSAPHQERR